MAISLSKKVLTRSFRDSKRGFTMIQLIIGTLLFSGMAAAAIFFSRASVSNFREEQQKTEVVRTNRDLEMRMRKDIFRAPAITGFTKNIVETVSGGRKVPYMAMYREPHDTFATDTDLDNLQLWTEAYGDLEVSAIVFCQNDCENLADRLYVYYEIEGGIDPTIVQRNEYVEKLFDKKDHFFTINSKVRNLHKKDGTSTSGACPGGIGFAIGTICRRLELDRTIHHSAANYRAELQGPVSIRAAEKVAYQVTGGKLKRVVENLEDPTQNPWDETLGTNIRALDVGFVFADLTKSGLVVPETAIPHPLDAGYLDECDGNCVTWNDVQKNGSHHSLRRRSNG